MKSVAFFSMLADGHMRRLLPLIAGVASRGLQAQVFSHRRFEPEITRVGGIFVDLFGRYPVEGADAESFPVGLRSVGYAGRYAGEVQRELEALRPALVVYDTFAMIGRVVAARLGIPYVNVCAGHNVDPARFQKVLAADPRVVISVRCLRAVETLRERFGVADASPFSYVSGRSPFLNVYGEPPEFLAAGERSVFEPVVFFGSLPSRDEIATRSAEVRSPYFRPGASAFRVYVSFGTVVWRSYPAEGLAALAAICRALARRRDVQVVVSLGGAELGPGVADALASANVAVHSFVDQWAILREADVFVTHHGLNSTHEAIYHGVPMISYPFFWDQPSLAARCQALGLAVPLTDAPRGPVTEEHADAALEVVARSQAVLRGSLATARDYELNVIAGREAVLDRLIGLG